MAKLFTDATIATNTTLNDADLMITVNAATGEISNILVSDVKAGLGGGVKTYAAVISQSGTSAPTAVESFNNTGATVSYTYNSTGDYSLTFSITLLGVGKTIILITNGTASTSIHAYRLDTSTINILTGADNAISLASLKIEIYP